MRVIVLPCPERITTRPPTERYPGRCGVSGTGEFASVPWFTTLTAHSMGAKTLVHSPAASGGFPVMAYRCEVCGKEPWVGKQVRFSDKRSSRRWLPNIQRVRVRHGNNSKRIRVCTSCIKAGKVEKA